MIPTSGFGALPAPPLLRLLLALLLCTSAVTAAARGTYQEPQDFISEAFAGRPPAAQTLWLSGAAGQGYQAIMGEAPPQLRLRYWAADRRSAWILEAIGKEYPITAGFVIDDSRIAQARVLIFRESRGWEVRHPFFTDQFSGAVLDPHWALDKTIDGITGATLSVRAMTRMARLALYLAQQVSTVP